MDLTYKERELIYNSLKYYKEHSDLSNSELQWDYDVLIQKFYSVVNINGVEPGFRSDV
jgi:hypothetical protein